MKLTPKINKKESLLLLGHNGLIGSALLKQLKNRNYKNIITVKKKKINLLNFLKLEIFFKKNKPRNVIIAAARAGGIIANEKYPFNFIYENSVIQNNIISLCIKYKCKKIIFLGSSCIYPKVWKKPFKEQDLTLSNLEKTNEYYAIAKISGLKLCEAFNKQFNKNIPKFITVIPPNLFGDNDNYNYQNSHVLAALLRKFYEACKKKNSNVEVWGTGKCKREFLYSIDAANMILDILEANEKRILKFTGGKFSHINIGTGKDYSINEIAKIVKKISGFKGKIINNKNFPDGVKRKVLNINLFNKICPNSKNSTKKIFEKNIKKVYQKLNDKKFKFSKNSTFNLPI
jgi:GDP-L-fucose synthase